MTEPTEPTAADDEQGPGPDPGNSGPDAWSAPLDDEATARAYGAVNDVAVGLPEPVLDEPEQHEVPLLDRQAPGADEDDTTGDVIA